MPTHKSRPIDFVAAGFEVAFAHLKLRIERACTAETQADWPARLVAGIRAVLAFAAADPAAANRLTNDTLDAGKAGAERHERLMAYLVERLHPGRELRGDSGPLPEGVEHAIAARTVALVGQYLHHGREDDLLSIGAQEAIEFALTPYVGSAVAGRIARR